MPEEADAGKYGDEYELHHGGYREVKSTIADINVKIEKLISSLTVLKWIFGTFGTVMTIGMFSVFSRAVDNESQIKVNTAHLLVLDNTSSVIANSGSILARLNSQELTDLLSRFNAFITRYDQFVRDELDRDSKTTDSIIELKQEMKNHEISDKEMSQDIERIDKLQQDRIRKEDGKKGD